MRTWPQLRQESTSSPYLELTVQSFVFNGLSGVFELKYSTFTISQQHFIDTGSSTVRWTDISIYPLDPLIENNCVIDTDILDRRARKFWRFGPSQGMPPHGYSEQDVDCVLDTWRSAPAQFVHYSGYTADASECLVSENIHIF